MQRISNCTAMVEPVLEPGGSPAKHLRWEQIRTGGYGGELDVHFLGDREYSDKPPCWSFARFGRTVTTLPDGRLVTTGGEHEDCYGPDLCIYADVRVLDDIWSQEGGVQHFVYPRHVFPPTDFHTATLYIYIGRPHSSDRVVRLSKCKA